MEFSAILGRISTDTTTTSEREITGYLGVCAGLLPIVTVIALDPAGWYPFSIAKWFAVAVVSLSVVALAVLSPAGNRYDTDERRVAAALWALIALVIVSAVTGLDGWYAWVGTPVRHLGAFAWVLFGAVFLAGRRVGASANAATFAVRGFVVAGGALGLYALVEFLIDTPVDVVSTSSRLGGPFGSAAYLGAACCLIGPVCVGVACSPNTRTAWRSVAAGSAVLVAIAVLGSGSRSAVLTLLVVGFASLCVLPSKLPRRQLATASIVMCVAALGGASRTGVFERTAGPASRLDEWWLAIQTIADHPALGVGPEGYRLVVDRYLDAAYVQQYGESVGIDRAHSGVLDVAVSSGLVAAGLYLATLVLIGWAAIRVVRRGTAVDVGISIAVLAFGIQEQLQFPIAELAPMFWLLAGVVVARAAAIRPSERPAAPSTTGTDRRVRVLGAVAVGALAIVVAIAGVRQVAADRLARDATRSSSVAAGIDAVEQAIGLAPRDVRLRILAAQLHEREQTLAGVDRALADVDDALSISSLEPTSRTERARLLSLRAAITGGIDDRARAAAAWDDLIAQWPACSSCRVGAALTALERGDESSAIDHLDVAVQLGDDTAADRLQVLRRD